MKILLLHYFIMLTGFIFGFASRKHYYKDKDDN